MSGVARRPDATRAQVALVRRLVDAGLTVHAAAWVVCGEFSRADAAAIAREERRTGVRPREER